MVVLCFVIDRHADRVNQEGYVRVEDEDHRVGRLPAIFQVRIEYRDRRIFRGTLLQELPGAITAP